MSVAACLITYNEEDMVSECLRWLNSLPELDQICVIDSFSTDKTWDIITNFETSKSYKAMQQEFTGFGNQKNACISMATCDWILLIDADETYGYQVNRMFRDLKEKQLVQYNAFRIATYLLYPDRNHFVHPNYLPFGLDPHIRIWRNGFCSYRGDCHERLYDNRGRDLHECNDNDILTLYKYKPYEEIYMLHHQQLKSKETLIKKGERWAELDMFRKSLEQKIQLDKLWWKRLNKGLVLNHKMVCKELPPSFRAYPT